MSDSRKYTSVFPHDVQRSREQHYSENGNTANVCGTLAQRAVGLPHLRGRGKLVWVWWNSGSTRPQGTRIMISVFVCNGTFGRRVLCGIGRLCVVGYVEM
eukprot:1156636-Pelagomonas_calceolata.AAC.29